MARIKGEGSWDEYKMGKYTYQRYRIVIEGERKVFYGKTKTEAMQKYRDFLQNHTPGTKKTALTVCDVAKEAVEARRGQIKATSYSYYAYAIKSLEKSKLGALQIHSVTFSDVQTYINDLASTKSLSTIKRQRVILTIAFSYAEDKEWIEKNPMNKVRLPNEANIVKEPKEHVFLSTEERKALETEAMRVNDSKAHRGKAGERLYGVAADAIVFILHTGLRIGELIALNWENTDIAKKFIHIRRNAPSNGMYITTPKRKASIRKVPLDGVALGIIKDLSENQKGEFVFHTKSGNMLNRNNIDRMLKLMVERSGIEQQPTLHDLRHTYASELIRNGVDMKTVQTVLGHSDISTTMNIYVHKSDDDLDILRNILE